MNTSAAHWIDSLTVQNTKIAARYARTGSIRAVTGNWASLEWHPSAAEALKSAFLLFTAPERRLSVVWWMGFGVSSRSPVFFSSSHLFFFRGNNRFSHRSLARPRQNHDAAVTHSLILLFWLSSGLLALLFFIYSCIAICCLLRCFHDLVWHRQFPSLIRIRHLVKIKPQPELVRHTPVV